MAKAWLAERNIPFALHVYDRDEDRFAMYDRLGLEGFKRTVPQIVVDRVRLGGYHALINSDLDERFRATQQAEPG
jgi:glutaredoxin